jgi:Tetratricopeptide repeat
VTARLTAAALVVMAQVYPATFASAQGDEAEGGRRWRHGQELYEQEHYLEAAREFEAGYAASPRPLFFFNIGQAYRKANELAKAKAAYEKLLALQPDFPQRADVEVYIRSINDALSLSELAPREPAPPANSGAAPSASPPAPLPARPAAPPGLLDGPSSSDPREPSPFAGPRGALPSPQTDARSEGTPSRSWLRKPWFWVIVGAVVAGSVAVAVVASQPRASCPGTVCLHE